MNVRGTEIVAASGAKATLHTKAFLVDRKELFIGSLNFDPRSANLNTESGVLIRSRQMAEMFGSDLDAELPQLKIGKSAVAFFQEDIDRFQAFEQEANNREDSDPAPLFIGAIEKMDDARWETTVKKFFSA